MRLQTTSSRSGKLSGFQSLHSMIGFGGFSGIWGLVFGIFFAASSGFCQSLAFTTLAGYPGEGNATGSAARFNNPWGIAVDASGNVYVADTDNHVIRKITSGGVVNNLAGLPGTSGSADGTGSAALFSQPQGVTVDSLGNVYVADTGNHTIRKITSAGVVTTLAGLAGNSGTNNGTGSVARFYEPEGIVVNGAGTILYVADTWNHTIRSVTSGGAVVTFAGTATTAGANNGTGTAAQFNNPQGVALDSLGNVYVGDTGNQLIRKITTGAVVTTLAGSAGNVGTNNATGTSALFWGPQGLAVGTGNSVYVADSFNNAVRKVTSAGVVTTFAGNPAASGSTDASGTAATFSQPQGIAIDTAGNLFVADSANGTIRKVTSAGVVTTFAGSPSTGSADGSPANARFAGPAGVALDNSGNSFVADAQNGTIRIVSASGATATFAGAAGNFGSSDGTSNNAHFYAPQSTAVDSSGNVYVSDTANHTIRKISSAGAVTTLAGSPGANGIADGTSANARFNYPRGLKADASGNLYVADSQNHTIRKITPAGVVTTIAGLAGYPGNIDGTSAGTGTNTARFNAPTGLAVDASGNVFVADTGNQVIRKITSGGVVSTLCGLPGSFGSADGTNNAARFNQPQDIVVDFSGNLYVLDTGNHVIRMIHAYGTNYAVTTVAGSAGLSGNVDGLGSSARFSFPAGLAINNVGAFSVGDYANNTIRVSGATFNTSPVIVTQPQDQTVGQNQDATFTVSATGSAPLGYQWQLAGTNILNATNFSYTRTNCQAADAGLYSVLVSNSLGTMPSSNALLTVILAPAISSQPQSTNINQGGTATFTVTASGTQPFVYQWRFDGTNISGANTNSYSVVNAQPGDSGGYSVIVSNAGGSVTSSVATLNVNSVPTPPTITVQPQSQTVAQGSSATFNVTATGSSPLLYHWLFNGTNLPSGTASNYTVLTVQPPNAGPYSVIVTNDYGSATSTVASLTVILPPIINLQPTNQLASVSNNVTFSVGLSQGDNPSYQWRFNGTAIPGANQPTLALNSITWTNGGIYTVAITNLAGSVTSAPASLTIQQAVFTFLDDFESYALGGLDKNTAGSANTSPSNPWWALSTGLPDGWLTNSGTGVTPHSGVQMLGTTNSLRQDYFNLLYRFNAGQVYYGNFMCEWWFYDPYGTNSSGATNAQDYIALCADAPVSTTGDTSSSFTSINQRMSLGAYNGNVGYNYSNYQARIIGGTGGTFGSGNSWYNTATIRSIGWHHARVIVGIPNATNAAPISMYIDNLTNATVTSPTAGTNGFNILEINHSMSKVGFGFYYDDLTFRAANDPWIIEQPISQTVNAGQQVSFTTVAVGTGYQWQFNGTNIGGATTSTYTVPAAGTTNVGTYACLISGANGVLSTTPAALALIAPAQPGHFDSMQVLGDGSFQLYMSGTAYTNYVLEFADNPSITNWNSLATLSGTNGLFQYNDFSSTSNSQRFYRLRVGP
jgi:sugar lactone lactonase YvrE